MGKMPFKQVFNVQLLQENEQNAGQIADQTAGHTLRS